MKDVYTITTGDLNNPVTEDEKGVRKRPVNGESMELDITDTTEPVDNGTAIELLYEVQDYPPIHITLIYGLQLALINVSFSVTLAIIIANFFCADSDTTAKLTSTTLFMAGLSTTIQTAFGIRLPIFQGPNPTFLVPLLNMKAIAEWQCPGGNGTVGATSGGNATDNAVEYLPVFTKIQLVSGSLLAASGVHMFLGASGLMGVLMKFIGPLTVSPVLVLIAVSLIPPTAELMEAHWGVSAFTFLLFLIMTAYFEFIRVPMPAYNKQKGCHISPYPVFQVLAILVSLGLGWTLSFILTATGTLTDDKNSVEYKARTDFEAEAIQAANWFYFPYPTQFGPPRFNVALFLGMLMCVIMSIVESLGDYVAVGNVCGVPRAPPHALNRGILMEGIGSAVSALLGAGHGTTSYSEMISAIGLTKVGSRLVFIVGGFTMMILGVVGKFSAVLINIPYPVLGGLALLTLATLLGMGIQVLNSVNLSKSRSVISIGLSIVLGILIPQWVRGKTKSGGVRINTGTTNVDHILLALLGNEVFVGGFIGFILDITLPGKRSRFGNIHGKSNDLSKLSKEKQKKYRRLYELPFIPNSWFRGGWSKYIPFLPRYQEAGASVGAM